MIFSLGMQFKFSHREVAISTPGMPDGIALSCGYALNPTAKPKRIDSWSCGPNAIFFQPVHGIYSLDGNRLKIAFAFTPNKDMNFGPLPPSKLAAGPKTSVVCLGPRDEGGRDAYQHRADLFGPIGASLPSSSTESANDRRRGQGHGHTAGQRPGKNVARHHGHDVPGRPSACRPKSRSKWKKAGWIGRPSNAKSRRTSRLSAKCMQNCRASPNEWSTGFSRERPTPTWSWSTREGF